MLIYCAWCGNYQGSTPARGHQIRPNICEIDTSTICPPCLEKFIQSSSTTPVALAAALPAEPSRPDS